MGSLCLRLFTMVHGCWQSISSCGSSLSLSQLLEWVSRISYQYVLGTY